MEIGWTLLIITKLQNYKNYGLHKLLRKLTFIPAFVDVFPKVVDTFPAEVDYHSSISTSLSHKTPSDISPPLEEAFSAKLDSLQRLIGCG